MPVDCVNGHDRSPCCLPYGEPRGFEHPMMMRRPLRYAGVAAVATLWTTLLTATVVARFDLFGNDPISYLGTRSRSAALFTVGLAVSAVLLTAFHQYLRGRYPVSLGFSLAMLVGLAGQMVAAFFRIGGDPAVHRIHTTSALVLGASLPLLMWRFAAAQPRGPWRRLTYAFFWAEAVACIAGVYLSAMTVAPVAEILPAAVFHAWIVTVTFAAASRFGPRPEFRSIRVQASVSRPHLGDFASSAATSCPREGLLHALKGPLEFRTSRTPRSTGGRGPRRASEPRPGEAPAWSARTHNGPAQLHRQVRHCMTAGEC